MVLYCLFVHRVYFHSQIRQHFSLQNIQSLKSQHLGSEITGNTAQGSPSNSQQQHSFWTSFSKTLLYKLIWYFHSCDYYACCLI